MRREDLFEAIGRVKESQLVVCEKHRNPSVVIHREDSNMKNGGKYCKQTSRNRMPKVWLIAAIITAMVFLMGCAIAYILSLEDMAFGNTVQEYYDGSTEEVTLLSLQGIQGTPGYQATKEWYEWLETYDTDGTVWDSHEAYGADFGDEYYDYGIYSQEMKDKLDEICEKYDLKLLGKMYHDPDVEAVCKALQIQGFFRPGIQVEAELEEIIYYANGSFRLEEYMKFPGYDKHIFTFRCHRKDSFTELYGDVGVEGTYEEWTYTTSYGVDVLLVIDKGGARGHAFMMVDNDIYTYYISIYEFENMPLPDRKELEAYAEAFDFTIEPQQVSQEDLQAADDHQKAAVTEYNEDDFYQGFKLNMTTNGWNPPDEYSDSFDSYVPYIREHASPENQYYTLLDLDGDGTEELLWGTADGSHLSQVAYMKDGVVTIRVDNYICEGNILLWDRMIDTYKRDGEVVEAKCHSYKYSTLTEIIVKLYYLPVADQWVEVRSGQEDRFISEAEAKQIMAQYPVIRLDMKPLSEYPLQ